MRAIIQNGHVLDTATMTYTEVQDVLMEGGLIVDVGHNLSAEAN